MSHELAYAVNGWLSRTLGSHATAPGARQVIIRSRGLGLPLSLHTAITSLQPSTISSLQKELRRKGFKDATVQSLLKGDGGGFTVDYDGHEYKFWIEESPMRANGRGIYHDMGLNKNDMVVHEDHRGRWRVDLITSATGNHITVGNAAGYNHAYDAGRVARAEHRKRGVRTGLLYRQQSDGNYGVFYWRGPNGLTARLQDAELEANSSRKKNVTVDDLPVASSGGKVLACPSCGSEFSAMRSDYFMMPKGEALACQACGVPLVLRKRTPDRRPPAQEARHSPGNRAWDAAEEKGLVRIVVEDEQENYFDVYGEPDSAEEREEIIDQISRDGLNHFASQYRKRRNDEWETADSIGMVIGDLASSGYEDSLKQAALDALKAPRRR